MIESGEVYWLTDPDELRLGNGVAHPHVVVQNNALNVSRIETTVVCAISTNRRRAFDLGNVLLDAGEGGLPRESFVAVGQVSVVLKTSLGARIGRLENARMEQVMAGIFQRGRASEDQKP